MIETIRKLCKENKISVSRLEKELNFGNGTISKWDKSIPSVLAIKEIADYFGVSMETIIEGE